MTGTQTLQQRLMDDVKVAMKSGDVVSREAIRFLQSVYRNAEIDKRGPLDEDEELALLQKQVKQRTESVDQFRAAGRDDLVEREEAQLRVIERYLPAQLTDDELAELVSAAVAETGASGPRDMGKVMPVLLPRIGGRADGKRVSSAVRARLAEG
ncbi:MAG TPA: GatB/YqeY domain-containing protein [Thermomicrobiales bacterium]|jgi:hypothetical protein|nr:GatB/YqeY domain-containing protein [Thermomicrobiales bacterium]